MKRFLSQLRVLSYRFVFSLLLFILFNYTTIAGASDLRKTEDQTFQNNKLVYKKFQSCYKKNEKWLLNNFREKSLFVYRYNPVSGKDPHKNNALRQLMASRLLAELSQEQLSLDEKKRKGSGVESKYFL